MGDPSGASSITEIQPQQSGRETVELTDEQKLIDDIFQAAMKNEWPKVRDLYINNKFVHDTKLTRSEDTALHLAISSYHPDRDDSLQHTHLCCIKKMIACIQEREDRLKILKQKNEKGNTPLHLAAELGSVPIIDCMVRPKDHLIWETNSKGETPLFIAAYRGKLKAFLYLHEHCQDEKVEDPIKLCRREDGDNILHAAISGEHFDLAYQIIEYYEPLVNRYNVEGMSPLHFLSRMPRVFKSGNHFGFIDRIIYYCINVEKLKVMSYKPEGINVEKQELMTHKAEGEKKKHYELKWDVPENYQTIVKFLELLWNGIRKTYDYLKWNNEGNSKVTNENQEKSPGHQTDRQNDLENPPIPDTTGATDEKQEKKSPDTTVATDEKQENKSPAERKGKHKLFPANCTVFIYLFKCLMKIVLLVLGIGLERIKKLEERKRRHTWGVQIMELMIEKDQRYKFYEHTMEQREKNLYGGPGEDPGKILERPVSVPSTPPQTVDDDKNEEGSHNTAGIVQSPTSSTDKKKADDLKSELPKTKDTPLLVASKMGILEMVRKILKKFPIAIQDTDSDEKNILLLAVEYRQTDVYNWLIGEEYPEYVLYQVDKHGNNAMHLAAMYQKLEVWRIPGSALQLQGERKWYKYVKHTLPPQLYVRYNNKGQSPRQIYGETHAKLLKDGTEWLIATANSCSVVAALIATIAFSISATFPGGADDKGNPHLENQPASDVFAIASLASLCFSITAPVFFLAILTSRCQHNDFEKELPTKLLFGLTSLFASITAVVVSFCTAHFFVLRDKLRVAAIPIYGATCISVVYFAFNTFPLYVDLITSYIQQLPLRRYKVFYTDSPETTSSDQKKGKEKDD